jgi:hypothetical protein
MTLVETFGSYTPPARVLATDLVRMRGKTDEEVARATAERR